MQSDPETVETRPLANAATRTFPSRFSMLQDAAQWVEVFCAAHDVHRDDRLRLTLILEELASNTIIHGHVGESDAPIAVSLAIGPAVIALRYEDTAPPFDVAAALDDAPDPLDADFDARPVGQLGLHLLAHYAADVRYVREHGRNRVTLTLRRSV